MGDICGAQKSKVSSSSKLVQQAYQGRDAYRGTNDNLKYFALGQIAPANIETSSDSLDIFLKPFQGEGKTCRFEPESHFGRPPLEVSRVAMRRRTGIPRRAES
jgi:hypothetical protein